MLSSRLNAGQPHDPQQGEDCVERMTRPRSGDTRRRRRATPRRFRKPAWWRANEMRSSSNPIANIRPAPANRTGSARMPARMLKRPSVAVAIATPPRSAVGVRASGRRAGGRHVKAAAVRQSGSAPAKTQTERCLSGLKHGQRTSILPFAQQDCPEGISDDLWHHGPRCNASGSEFQSAYRARPFHLTVEHLLPVAEHAHPVAHLRPGLPSGTKMSVRPCAMVLHRRPALLLKGPSPTANISSSSRTSASMWIASETRAASSCRTSSS